MVDNSTVGHPLWRSDAGAPNPAAGHSRAREPRLLSTRRVLSNVATDAKRVGRMNEALVNTGAFAFESAARDAATTASTRRRNAKKEEL